jgi:hypothetical protein
MNKLSLVGMQVYLKIIKTISMFQANNLIYNNLMLISRKFTFIYVI